jgi:hypothetical protein
MAVTDKTDDALHGFNDFLRSIADKVTPNAILMIVIVNSFALGILTTGFLGDKSIETKSLEFTLFVWQFIAIFVLSSRHVDLTTSYLGKFYMCALFGYIWQWEIFGLIASKWYPEITTIEPIMEHPLAAFGFANATALVLFGYCFRGNERNTNKGNIYTLDKEKQNVAS